jgi:predicted MPP superfamily phosphohydrolase
VLPRRTRVFDLLHGDALIRPRCIASFDARDAIVRIAFASDLHLAAVWDDIADAIERHGPEWRRHLLHPIHLFERMIAEVDDLARRGELDIVVLGGDLVDHVFRQRRGNGGNLSDTNLPLLLERIARLPVPIYAIPGNHDYRLFPWRARIYPFRGAGIPQSEARRIMKRAGLWDRWPIHPRDVESLRTQDEGNATLWHHLSALAPLTDFTVDAGALRLIFLSTGRDVLPRWREVERGRIGMLLRSIPISYHHPDCEGFSDGQIASLRTALEDCRNVALFFHAPLLNPPPGTRIEARLTRLDPPDDDRLSARIGFERKLFGSGLRHGVFFRNPACFVRTLASFPGSLTTFSGHVHGTHTAELDPRTLAVRSVGIRQAHSNGVHALINAPALGQTATRDGEAPGYLLARFDGGRLTSVQRRTLSELST